MTLIVDAASWVLVIAGSAFLVIGAVGLVRMPDVFTRMHATSVSDTAGAGLLILGMILQAGFSLITVKLLFILLIFFFTGPVATHALARAALSVGMKPMCFDAEGRKRTRMPLTVGGAEAARTPDALAKSGSGKSDAAAAKPATRRKRPTKPKGGGSSKR